MKVLITTCNEYFLLDIIYYMIESFKRKFEKVMNKSRGEVNPMNSTISDIKNFQEKKKSIEENSEEYLNNKDVT